jgi:hypothetical protein
MQDWLKLVLHSSELSKYLLTMTTENAKPRKPSIKQIKAVANLVENGGSISKAMVQAGYSEATAKTPQKLTESEGFKTLMAQMGVSDEKLINVINDGLDAIKPNEFTGEVLPDHQARHKYLETALRLKGYGKVGSTLNVQTDGGEVKVVVVNYADPDTSSL